jgi:dipeptidyl aminopeptidase/acylaminoacyl peptidase
MNWMHDGLSADSLPRMRRLFPLALILVATSLAATSPAPAQQVFTLQQILSAPYALALTAAPVGTQFAWIENAEGRRNIWVGGPQAAARQITTYTEDDGQDIDGLAWSPDGTSLAYNRGAENGASGKPANPAHLQRPTPVEVWVQPLAASHPPELLGEGHAPLFSRDGRSVLFLRGGQIWSADLTTSVTAHQLVFDRGSASSLTLSPDGRLLAFVSRRKDHSFIGLFDLGTHALRFLSPSTGSDLAPSFSPDSRQIAWLRKPFTEAPEFATNRTSAYPWSIQLADVASGEAHTLYSPKPNERGSVLPHLSSGGPHVFWSAENKLIFFSEADGWVHLYSIQIASKDKSVKLDEHDSQPRLLTPGAFEVEDAMLGSSSRTIIYASNATDADRRHLWTIDLVHANAEPVALTHGSGIETHPQMDSTGAVAAIASDASTPSHPVLVATDGTLAALHAGVLPQSYPTTLVTPQQVLLHSTDGTALHAQLFKPELVSKIGKRPAIVFFHGGPERQMLLGYPAMDYYSNAYAMNQYLVSRGFIVLSVNYRCGIGYGTDFRQCKDSGAAGAKEYNDVLAAAAYLRSRDDVDVKRIGAWGGSYGGYLTALALARNSDLFAAGVDFHGVHDWNLEDDDAKWLRGSNAEKDAIALKARNSSPIAAADQWRSPVLFIHGDDDPEVAYAETPVLADALRARGVPVEELILPDEVHDFLLHRDWLASYEAGAKFFERTLKLGQ